MTLPLTDEELGELTDFAVSYDISPVRYNEKAAAYITALIAEIRQSRSRPAAVAEGAYDRSRAIQQAQEVVISASPPPVSDGWRDNQREELKTAFVAGCCAVLTWTNSGMPTDDLDEAGYDYVASVAPPSPIPNGEK